MLADNAFNNNINWVQWILVDSLDVTLKYISSIYVQLYLFEKYKKNTNGLEIYERTVIYVTFI